MRKQFEYELVKPEFEYSTSKSTASVMLEESSHQDAGIAVNHAIYSDLEIQVYSLTDILSKVQCGQDPIKVCAEETKTRYEEQLKSIFVADSPLDGKHRPNAAIGIVRYSDKVDYKKMASVITDYNKDNIQVRGLKSNSRDLEILKITPGFMGINRGTLWVPALFTGEDFEPYSDYIPGLKIIDNSIRELEKITFLVGKGKADALVVVSPRSGKKFGYELDNFFGSYFGGGCPYTIADIKQNSDKI